MEKGIVLQGFVPIRKEPFKASEMVSQVLFGECFEIIESNREWTYIGLDFDGCKGWIETSSFSVIEDPNTTPDEYALVTSLSTTVTRQKINQQLLLPAGSVVNHIVEGLFNLNGELFLVRDTDSFLRPSVSNDLHPIAEGLVSVPYIWGGRCGFGFDSAGLVKYLSRLRGLDLPRESQAQAEQGKNVNFIHEIQSGDLAFFDNAEGEITHAGVILDGGRIIHAAGIVRIDRLDQQGIFNVERGKYTHRLRVIKRV